MTTRDIIANLHTKAAQQLQFLKEEYGRHIPEGFALDSYNFAANVATLTEKLEKFNSSAETIYSFLEDFINDFPNSDKRAATEYIRAELMMCASFGEVEA